MNPFVALSVLALAAAVVGLYAGFSGQISSRKLAIVIALLSGIVIGGLASLEFGWVEYPADFCEEYPAPERWCSDSPAVDLGAADASPEAEPGTAPFPSPAPEPRELS